MRSIALSSVFAFVVTGCGGAESVSSPETSSEQRLQTKKDGTATGDGASCSWAETATYDAVASSAPDAPVPAYTVGEEFKSIDGCNDCACTAKGIMCTLRACVSPPNPGEEPSGCPALARICNDGSTAKAGPSCSHVCPEDRPVACTDDAMRCPDGSYVGRSGPKCEFVCPK